MGTFFINIIESRKCILKTISRDFPGLGCRLGIEGEKHLRISIILVTRPVHRILIKKYYHAPSFLNQHQPHFFPLSLSSRMDETTRCWQTFMRRIRYVQLFKKKKSVTGMAAFLIRNGVVGATWILNGLIHYEWNCKWGVIPTYHAKDE